MLLGKLWSKDVNILFKRSSASYQRAGVKCKKPHRRLKQSEIHLGSRGVGCTEGNGPPSNEGCLGKPPTWSRLVSRNTKRKKWVPLLRPPKLGCAFSDLLNLQKWFYPHQTHSKRRKKKPSPEPDGEPLAAHFLKAKKERRGAHASGWISPVGGC